MQIVLQEQPDHRMRRDEIDLEAAMRRDHALPLEPGEFAVGPDRGVGIEQIVEPDVGDRHAGLEPITRAPRRGRMQAEHLVGFLQRRIVGEDRLQMRDPVAALAGLAVGNALAAAGPAPRSPSRTRSRRRRAARCRRGGRVATPSDISPSSRFSAGRAQRGSQWRQTHPTLALRHGLDVVRLRRHVGAPAGQRFDHGRRAPSPPPRRCAAPARCSYGTG